MLCGDFDGNRKRKSTNIHPARVMPFILMLIPIYKLILLLIIVDIRILILSHTHTHPPYWHFYSLILIHKLKHRWTMVIQKQARPSRRYLFPTLPLNFDASETFAR